MHRGALATGSIRLQRRCQMNSVHNCSRLLRDCRVCNLEQSASSLRAVLHSQLRVKEDSCRAPPPSKTAGFPLAVRYHAHLSEWFESASPFLLKQQCPKPNRCIVRFPFPGNPCGQFCRLHPGTCPLATSLVCRRLSRGLRPVIAPPPAQVETLVGSRTLCTSARPLARLRHVFLKLL